MGTANDFQREIVNHYSLVAFAREHGGKMSVGQFVNKETGERFSSCVFHDGTDEGKKTFVPFSSKLNGGVPLSSEEVAKQQKDLQVVQFDNGHFRLCSKGKSSWQDVNLDLD